ncbi:MAG: aminotransferase class I/II-fold pyridoxal phosphate-dependent enzyme, partial [Cytophagales bacterium]|nr:aminotransferase class I/II-fold pyridoxal phosphate-dependent enzyme [Cytophagales bacterium]
MIKFLDLEKFHAPILQELEEAVGRVVASGWYIGGEEVRFFEEDFARYLGIKHCIGCASGTDALELILRAYEIGPGDEVIVPAMTWVSDAEAVSLVGATPVFADILEDEYTLSPQALSKQITSKTKAIIAVHLYGL